ISQQPGHELLRWSSETFKPLTKGLKLNRTGATTPVIPFGAMRVEKDLKVPCIGVIPHQCRSCKYPVDRDNESEPWEEQVEAEYIGGVEHRKNQPEG
ncbi:uncharacterized protein PG986_006639, partial [Apiospora aurea]